MHRRLLSPSSIVSLRYVAIRNGTVSIIRPNKQKRGTPQPRENRSRYRDVHKQHSTKSSTCLSPKDQKSLKWHALSNVWYFLPTNSIAKQLIRMFLQTLHFSAYDEYCSKYSIMINEISNSQRLNSGWPAYESGVEALARSMSTLDARAGDQRKGLTIGDLLIKVFLLLFEETVLTRSQANSTSMQVSATICRPS